MRSLYILLGLLLGSGLWLVISTFVRSRRSGFAERIAPQMRSVTVRESLSRETEETPTSLGAVLLVFFGPMLDRISSRMRYSSMTDETLRERLRRAGEDENVSKFRAEQLLWALAGVGMMSALTVIGVIQERISVPAGIVLIAVCGVSGFMARDWWLGERIKKREKMLITEFPALAELMALSVTAGESALGALERICRTSNGELSREFSDILAQTRTGSGLLPALYDFARRTQVPALNRFVDGVAVAIERGTPLADVLRAQAQDARDNAKRELMETAGKKEIAMLAPVVFFILPLTVVFAIFPGLSLLHLTI